MKALRKNQSRLPQSIYRATRHMNVAPSTVRERLRPLHVGTGSVTGHVLAAATHVALVVACVVAWAGPWWPATVLLWPAIAWMNHAALSRLHEAAHGMLVRSRIANELLGMTIGTLSLTPLSVYRYVHAQHHIHLGREKDPEFWPYNLPGCAKFRRRTFAWLELAAGWAVTPLLYSIRTAAAWPSLARTVRRRLGWEWITLVGFWAAVLLAIDRYGIWEWFLVGHLVPVWLVGTMQTVRKFTEHLGRFGDTVLDMTRTVVYERPLGRAASRSQLHVEHHGTHHRWVRIPYQHLPAATSIVYGADEAPRTFPNHWSAIRDMLPHLLDPRLGPQWK